MEKAAFLYLLFPIFIGINIREYRRELLQIFKLKLLGDIPQYDLVIVVVSARDNFRQRQAIRDTWLRGMVSNKASAGKILVKFVIGGNGCQYPPEDRADQYGCSPWNVTDPVLDRDILAVEAFPQSSEESTSLLQMSCIVTSLAFRVHSPIFITKLGLYKQVGKNATVTVKLIDAVSQTEVVGAVFENDSGDIVGGFYYKTVESYILPAGFEGIVTAEIVPETPHRMLINFRRNDGGKLISFINHYPDVLGHYADCPPDADKAFGVSFMYKSHEPATLKQHIFSARKRHAFWAKSLTTQQEKLLEEAGLYHDIVFVDIVDVYRNIPSKLLKFYEWLLETTSSRYVMKTDDDCFVDVDKVFDKVKLLNSKTTSYDKFWWGRFRHNWAVERFGKWAEVAYRSPAYPAFACGAGYVLGSDLVRWVAENSDSLEKYQGEDVAMGVWLAAIGPQYKDDSHWQCEKVCDRDMYVMPELSPQELMTLWNYKEKCGNPCGCS